MCMPLRSTRIRGSAKTRRQREFSKIPGQPQRGGSGWVSPISSLVYRMTLYRA
eukprot:jgi/Mesvir1/7460/Mv25813-RA.1